MKNLFDFIRHSDLDKQEQVAPQKRQKLLDDPLRKIPGFILWSFNIETKEIKQAVYKKVKRDYFVRSLVYNPAYIQIRYELESELNCIYKQRLNRKSFEKYLKEEGLL